MTVTQFDTPFRHWVMDGLAVPGEAHREINNFQGRWVLYDDAFQRKRIVERPDALGPACEAVCNMAWDVIVASQIPALRHAAELRRDPSGYGGAIHAMGPGDWLECHLDRALLPGSDPPLELRLNVVVFLVPEWKPQWGGALQFYDAAARKAEASILPAPGRAVVWEPGDLTFHGVRRVGDDCPVTRAAANCFYYAPARPAATRPRALFAPQR